MPALLKAEYREKESNTRCCTEDRGGAEVEVGGGLWGGAGVEVRVELWGGVGAGAGAVWWGWG